MKKEFISIVMTIALLFFGVQSFALDKTGQTGFKFLDVSVGARAAAMGEAFTVMGNDANALFYNPAGIAFSDSKADIIFHKNNWIADISYNAVGLTTNLKNWGVVGVSVLAADYPKSIGTIVSDNAQGYEETGEIQADAFAVGLSYARQLTQKFSIGGTVRYAAQGLGTSMIPTIVGTDIVSIDERENKVSGVAYDIGTIFYPGFKSFRFGMSICNFSEELKYEEESFQLPLTFRLGVGMDLLDLFGEHPDMNFLADIEVVHPRDYSQRLHIGGEFWYKNMIALRSGYKVNYDEEGFSAGFGFNIRGIQIDYAYTAFGRFEAVNRFSCGFSF